MFLKFLKDISSFCGESKISFVDFCWRLLCISFGQINKCSYYHWQHTSNRFQLVSTLRNQCINTNKNNENKKICQVGLVIQHAWGGAYWTFSEHKLVLSISWECLLVDRVLLRKNLKIQLRFYKIINVHTLTNFELELILSFKQTGVTQTPARTEEHVTR